MEAPFTRARFDGILDDQWGRKAVKTDWLGMERLLCEALASTAMTAAEKVGVCKEIIDCYTRRGHFCDYGREEVT